MNQFNIREVGSTLLEHAILKEFIMIMWGVPKIKK